LPEVLLNNFHVTLVLTYTLLSICPASSSLSSDKADFSHDLSPIGTLSTTFKPYPSRPTIFWDYSSSAASFVSRSRQSARRYRSLSGRP
jgi:hypothetical protein